ncbi:hypothetical protein HaLaN_13376 [Haematococcus lacustris]|uniref:Uncharacterized protein n=1 Tax=Haematococcus lacustris TaxID=44745 RepID=A0A699ZDA3_HAELA|nr:hypothetical protein HaLaN_13376 [Haematococcus lacustris]
MLAAWLCHCTRACHDLPLLATGSRGTPSAAAQRCILGPVRHLLPFALALMLGGSQRLHMMSTGDKHEAPGQRVAALHDNTFPLTRRDVDQGCRLGDPAFPLGRGANRGSPFQNSHGARPPVAARADFGDYMESSSNPDEQVQGAMKQLANSYAWDCTHPLHPPLPPSSSFNYCAWSPIQRPSPTVAV